MPIESSAILMEQLKDLIAHASNPEGRCMYAVWVAEKCPDCQRLAKVRHILSENAMALCSDAQMPPTLAGLMAHHYSAAILCCCVVCNSERYKRVSSILMEVFN